MLLFNDMCFLSKQARVMDSDDDDDFFAGGDDAKKAMPSRGARAKGKVNYDFGASDSD